MTSRWCETELGNVARVSTGPFGSLLHKSDYARHGIPLVNPINIRDGCIVADPEKLLSQETARRLSAYILQEGDVIVGRRGEIGRCAVISDRESGWLCGTGSFFVRPSSSVHSYFLAYLLRSSSYRKKLESSSTGATMSNLSNHALSSLAIPVPPVEEQRRIVAILDEAFEGIDTAVANTKTNFGNAQRLLSEIRAAEFEALAKNASSVPLGSICEFENGDRGKNYPGKEHRVDSGIPFINAGHLTEEGIDHSSMDFISPDRFDLLGNGKIKPGDILFCLRGSLGKFSSVGSLAQGAIASSLIILRPKAQLSHDYLLAYLAGDLCAGMIEKFRGGAAQPNLGAKDLSKFELPLPSIEEQERVTKRLQQVGLEVKRLRAIYQRKLSALDELKQATLHKAFAGELTAQAAQVVQEAAE